MDLLNFNYLINISRHLYNPFHDLLHLNDLLNELWDLHDFLNDLLNRTVDSVPKSGHNPVLRKIVSDDVLGVSTTEKNFIRFR